MGYQLFPWSWIAQTLAGMTLTNKNQENMLLYIYQNIPELIYMPV